MSTEAHCHDTRSLSVDESLYDYMLSHSLRQHTSQLALREATRTHAQANM